jgi:hypothetical protein
MNCKTCNFFSQKSRMKMHISLQEQHGGGITMQTWLGSYPLCDVRGDGMTIRVRIDSPHPLLCRKWRLNVAVLETRNTEAPCHSRCGTIRVSPLSTTLSAEHRPIFRSPSRDGDVYTGPRFFWSYPKDSSI